MPMTKQQVPDRISPERNMDNPPLRGGFNLLAAPEEGGVLCMLLLKGPAEANEPATGLAHAVPSVFCPRGVSKPLTLRLATGLLAVAELPQAPGLAPDIADRASICCAAPIAGVICVTGVNGALGAGIVRDGVSSADS